MFKNIIGPMQAWLLSQGKCVGCGKVLPSPKEKKISTVFCECERVYIYDAEANKYRRATIEEAK